MREDRKKRDSNSLDFYDSGSNNEETSRISRVIFFLLASILVVSTIAYGAVDLWATAILAVFTGLIALLWLSDSFLNREFKFNSSILQLPLLGLLLIGCIQLLPLRNADLPGELLSIPTVSALSLEPYATRLFVVQLCIFIIFFAAMLLLLENHKRQRITVFIIVVFSSVMAFFGIIQSLTGENPNAILGMRENPDALPFATFVNRHHFAGFMNMTIGLTLGLLYGNSTKRDKRLLLLIALVLMGIALMFTGSRGGILSLLGVIAFVILANLFGAKGKENTDDEETTFFNLKRNFLLIGSGITLFLVLIGSALFFGGESEVTRGIGMMNQADVSSGRFHFWQTGWQIFLNNPIIGAGLDAFAQAFTQYDTWNGEYRPEHAHNEYLNILAEAGILGFICLVAFIFFLYKKGLRIALKSEDRFKKGAAIGALAGCTGILIHSFFDFPLRTFSNAFFFLTLAAIATLPNHAPKTYRRRSRKSRDDYEE
jgi:O-antigen ligase